ncbi:MAG: hypothetical protein A3H98_10690 [Bacteroidetes bacterium RIFCSPLOWO2_02_FULL_36_8]|nr:MAG: hypothetical protein A3H98_10690 [Bacteroidetes bacterium RIFCSPLOWO2_02_FULL_36_8]OFY69766.1 MAG: hypothetical protein A3G23_11475 [Bacteroidetes bacterium RIFCSPLOWO2_12_FULL_37_12]
MLTTLNGIVKKRRIRLIEKANIPEGTKLLITILSDEDVDDFWLTAGTVSLNKIWNNTEDDVYAKLL